MQILFINPPNAPITSKTMCIEPIDVLVVASHIKSLGHDVSVLDMDRNDGCDSELTNILNSNTPDVITIIHDYHIPLFQDASHGILYSLIEKCKKYNVKVVVGGKLSTYYPRKLLSRDIYPDVVIANEVESVLENLLTTSNWTDNFLNTIPNITYKIEGRIIRTKNEKYFVDIQNFPIPDRKLVKISDYIDVRTMLSSRSCGFSCSFCSVPGFWGKRRVRTAQQTFDEISYLSETFGSKKILFLDDNATTEKERMQELSRLLIDAKMDVKLGCLGNILHFDDKTMHLMYEAGFRWIHHGIESASPELLKSAHKFVPIERIKEILKKTKDIGFRIRTSWIMDLPGSTPQTIDDTTNLILETMTDEIRIHYLSIRFGSELFHQYTQTNLDSIPEQYIHHAPVLGKDILSESLIRSSNALLEALQPHNYHVIRTPDDNGIFTDSSLPDTKAISFCPLKYGIGWR